MFNLLFKTFFCRCLLQIVSKNYVLFGGTENLVFQPKLLRVSSWIPAAPFLLDLPFQQPSHPHARRSSMFCSSLFLRPDRKHFGDLFRVLVCNIAENGRKHGEFFKFCFARNVLYTQHLVDEGITTLLEHSTKENIHFGVSNLQGTVNVQCIKCGDSLRFIESG